jgi:DNA mismatch endonuclease (patch repair protein)
MTDIFDKQTRSRIMSKIRGKNTKPEVKLRKLLRQARIRHTAYQKLPGTPDLTVSKRKVAIFVDGDFWHGYNWKVLGKKPPNKFWRDKISRNIARDKRANSELKKLGWKVVRIRESALEKRPKACLERIRRALKP